MRLLRIPDPFDHPDFIFDPKLDGFRALAHVRGHRCELVSRNRHAFRRRPKLAEESTACLRRGFGTETALRNIELPCSVTLTILKDTPESSSWRVDVVVDKGQSVSYSWSGPKDGSLQPLKDAKGQIIAQESLKQDQDGALLRHGVDSNDGSSFDGRAVLSADGNTITDVVSSKTKDGKILLLAARFPHADNRDSTALSGSHRTARLRSV